MSEDQSSARKDSKPVALETRDLASDGRRYSPSVARNRDVIAAVFAAYLPNAASVLEVASGTGEHGFHITQTRSDLSWTYSDIDTDSLQSQSAWGKAASHDRLRGPLALDVMREDWANGLGGQFDTVFCANMIHIAPLEAAIGLIKGAGDLLSSGGHLLLYGPFARKGKIAPSNAEFSANLKRRDPLWGVRDLDHELISPAEKAGLKLSHVIEMPSNNLSVIFQRVEG
ncbi:MAG: DUF938 domain-containing protein [Pseudomonadota bacterium]